MNKKLILGLAALAFASAALTQTTEAGSLSFSTESDTVVKNCPIQVDILIDTEWEEVNSLDLGIVLNDEFEINEVKTDEGVLRTYSQPNSMTAKLGDFKGKEILSMLASTTSPNWYNGAGKLLSLTITPKTNKLNLEFYMIPGNEGEDSNLMVKKGDKIVDVLSTVNNKNITTTEGECNVEALEKMELTEVETTVLSEEVEDTIADTTEINKDVIFDESQEVTLLQEYGLYIAVILIAIILILILITRKKKKNK